MCEHDYEIISKDILESACEQEKDKVKHVGQFETHDVYIIKRKL